MKRLLIGALAFLLPFLGWLGFVAITAFWAVALEPTFGWLAIAFCAAVVVGGTLVGLSEM